MAFKNTAQALFRALRALDVGFGAPLSDVVLLPVELQLLVAVLAGGLSVAALFSVGGQLVGRQVEAAYAIIAADGPAGASVGQMVLQIVVTYYLVALVRALKLEP